MDILEYIKRVNANFDKQPEPRYNTKKYFTDNVDDIGPGSSNKGKLPRLNVMPENYNSESRGTGVMIDPRGLQDGKIPLPTQGLDDGGRVGFENGKKVKTPEQYRKNLLTKQRYYENLTTESRRKKTLQDKINLIKNAEKTFAENPGLKEAHINNLYRKENGKFIRRNQPLRPFAEVFADFGITPSMAKEFSSIIRKELKADGSLGTAKESAVQEKRNKTIKKGKADAGPTSEPINKKLKNLKKTENSKLINLLKENSNKLVSSIRSNPDLMDQLESVFDSKKGVIEKVKISDDEIKKLVNNGFYSEEHKTPVQTGKKNIEFPTNKGFVTKQTNSKVLAPMNKWLNTGNNYKLVDGEVKDLKLKNLENWLTKNKIRTKVEGARGYFGDKSLKSITAEEAIERQFDLLKIKDLSETTVASKAKEIAGKTLKGAGTVLNKGVLGPLTAIEAPSLAIPQSAFELGNLIGDVKRGEKTDASAAKILLPTALSYAAASKQGLDLFADNAGKIKKALRSVVPFNPTLQNISRLSKGSAFLTPAVETAIQAYNAKKRLEEAKKKSSVFEPTVDTLLGDAPKSYYNKIMSEIPSEGRLKEFSIPFTDKKFTLPEVGVGEFQAASGGLARASFAGGLLARLGKYTKAEFIIQRMKNSLKQAFGKTDPDSKYVNETFPNMIKELEAKPELGNNENVFKMFSEDLPKNQKIVVHSDDSLDFFTQSDFGPQNIKPTMKFAEENNISVKEASRILKMNPEDQVLETTRLNVLKDKGRTRQASGGLTSLTRTIPPQRGPQSQGLASFMKNGKR